MASAFGCSLLRFPSDAVHIMVSAHVIDAPSSSHTAPRYLDRVAIELGTWLLAFDLHLPERGVSIESLGRSRGRSVVVNPNRLEAFTEPVSVFEPKLEGKGSAAATAFHGQDLHRLVDDAFGGLIENLDDCIRTRVP
jgi:hypothetical protein